jgi:hypothetical protein
MKIMIADYPASGGISPAVTGDTVEIDTHGRDVQLVDVFTGVLIDTDQGAFGICQRDSGLEILLDGKVILSTTEALGNEPTRESIAAFIARVS